jgi:hypothetical protein
MTNDTGNNEMFKTGAPQNLRALVRGHLVYDPRLDSTRVIDSSTSPDTTGTGAHRHNDPSTWEWSENPALCLADWLTWADVGMGEPDTRIDWELVAAAADVCEEQVVIPPASSPDITQDRYTCNLVFFADQQRGSIKEILEESMLGRCVFSQGKWRMWAGDVLAATVNLSEANLAGQIQVEAGTPSKQRYNKVVGKFIDPSRNYQATAYPEQVNASYATDDGGEKSRTFDFNACNNTYEAQRNAIIKLRQSRNMNIVVFEGNWSCFQVQPGTTVTVDFDPLSWTGVKFFVTEWELRQDGTGVNLTMVEESDSAWTDPAIGDYTTRTPTGELVPPGDKAVKLTGATIENTRQSGTCHAGVRLGSDGKVYYQTANGGYSSFIAPPDEWLRRGADYEFRATLNSGGPLDVGNTGTWENDTADRSYSVQQVGGGSKTANVTIEITDDSAASPINVITQGTFTLTATIPLPDNSPFLADIDIVQNAGSSAASFSARFQATIATGAAGELQFNDYPNLTGFQNYDGNQWHTGQGTSPLSFTPGDYMVRFTNSLGPNTLNSVAAAEDTFIRLNSQRDFGMDYLGSPGTYTNTSTYEIIDNPETSPAGPVLASADFTIEYVV